MRLFVAIRFSPAVLESLTAAISALRHQGSGTFTRPENLHLTLAFLGETENLDAARRAVDSVCGSGRFSFSVGGMGCFDDLWWAGVEDSLPLKELALTVQSALRSEGFAIEKRSWKPHITLVRRWRGPKPRVPLSPVSMRAERVSLMKSERIDGKLVYTELHSVRL